MLEAGTYRARAVNAALGKADTGTNQIAVLFELLDVPNYQITWYGFFTEATYERTLESLEHCGWTGDDLSVFDAEYVSMNGLSGLDANEVSLVIAHEEGQDGKTRPRVRWVNRLGGTLAVKNVMSGAEVKSFAAQMRGAIMKRRQERGAAPGGEAGKSGFPWENEKQQ